MDDSDDQARQKWQRDFNDLENERAGRNNGRIKRFFPVQEALAPEAGARNDTAAVMLGLTVQHEAQARLVQQIEEAEYAAALALEEACRREQAARDHLDQIRRNATRTEDGRTVYLTADGKRAFDDDGNELTPADIAGINWRDGAPTWEQRQAAAARVERTVQDRQEIEAYQERLQQGRGRLENGQPVTADESDSIRRDIEAMPDSVRRHLGTLRRPGASAASHYEGQGIEARPATPAFTRAAIGPGEIAAIRETPAPAPESLDI